MKKDLQRTEQSTATQSGEQTIGIDLGDRWSRYCILSSDGEVVEEDRIRTSAGEFEPRFKKLPTTRIVVEAGTFSLRTTGWMRACWRDWVAGT
jgi:hypothetical protein